MGLLDANQPEMRATPRKNRMLGLLADGIGVADQFARKPFGYENPPAGLLSDFLAVPQIQRTLDRLSYGEPLTTGRGMTTQIRPDTVDAAMAVVPAVAKWPKQTLGIVSALSGTGFDQLAAGPAASAFKTLEKSLISKYGKNYYWSMPESELAAFSAAEDAARAEKASAAAARKLAAKDGGTSNSINKGFKFSLPDELFHGSHARIDKFDPLLLGSNTGANDASIGFHFARDRADADFYAGMAARNMGLQSGYVGRYRVESKNPLVISPFDDDGTLRGKLREELLSDKLKAKSFAEKNGYDSIVYPHGTNVDSAYTAISFDPSKIRLIE